MMRHALEELTIAQRADAEQGAAAMCRDLDRLGVSLTNDLQLKAFLIGIAATFPALLSHGPAWTAYRIIAALAVLLDENGLLARSSAPGASS